MIDFQMKKNTVWRSIAYSFMCMLIFSSCNSTNGHNIAGFNGIFVARETDNLNGARDIVCIMINGRDYVYIANAGDGSVSMFEFDSAGNRLMYLGNKTDDEDLMLSGAGSLAMVSVSGAQYLFVAGSLDNGISSFEIASDGTLSSSLSARRNVRDNNMLELEGVSSLATVTAGQKSFLLAAASTDDGVSVFEVTGLGSLIPRYNVTDTDSLNLDGASAITSISIGEKVFVAVAGKDDNGISIFELNQTNGQLTLVQNIADDSQLALAGVRSIETVTVSGMVLLLVAGEVDDGMSVFKVADSGEASHHVTISDNEPRQLDGAWDIATVNVNGITNVFVAGRHDNGVSVFRIDARGQFTDWPSVVDQFGAMGVYGAYAMVYGQRTFLFVSNDQENSMSVFR